MQSELSASPAPSLSEDWQHRAREVMAGKQSNFRPGPPGDPVIADRASGFRIWDVDNKDYMDFVLGMGPAIWGHSNQEYFDSVRAQLDRQFSSPSSIMHTTAEIELAEKIVEHVPCADRVRFGLTGSEADQLVMRLARGATGRPYVVRCEGHYHGWLDNVFDGHLNSEGDAGSPQTSARCGAGIAPHALSDILMVRWGDLEGLEALLEERSHEIAMIMMEAVLCNNYCCPPRPGYLEGARALCDKYGVLLCFDEVITGFRMSIGGAQGALGVTPDLAVFGKALAGGLPLAAIAGRDEVMSVLKDNKVLGGGTFNSFPLAMAAGLTSMEMLERDNGAFFTRLENVQDRIVSGLRASAERQDFKLMVQGPAGMFAFAFIDLDVAYAPHELEGADMATALRFRKLMEEEGVLSAGGFRMVTSGDMPDEDVEEAISRIDRAMVRLRETA
ncbi:MAG: aminotransferase class III-fold pyridoxal phosphate-dependent enzyme [Parvularculaceae bacterium]|nr:aminotransferase class III-fold pyridoxal phosphate-dependent enzyme [Parvularculaceae bacterium]